MDIRTMAILALALLSATAPLELSQLTFAIVGALAYALIQALMPLPRRSLPKASITKKVTPPSSGSESAAAPRAVSGGGASKSPGGPRKPAPVSARRVAPGALPGEGAGIYPPQPEVRQPSSQPVARVSFQATGWEDQVDELVAQLAPTAQGERVVKQLAEIVKRELSALVPEIEVIGFACGDLARGTAFGVAVPEVDIVASASPHILMARMQGARGGGANRSDGAPAAPVDARKLQKSTIRQCTDRLVGTGGFKFRRSAFRGQDPKVTLLASSSLGIYDGAIPLDFSVNSTTPLYNAALITECGQLEPRSRSLILLVKRWAKDRGFCHAAKGHFSPYAWTLLVIFFLQVGDDAHPLLPPLEGFKLSSGLASGQSNNIGEAGAKNSTPRTRWASAEGPKKSVGALFKEFLNFYATEFDFRNEAVSVRLGRRAPPNLGLPLAIVVHEDGVTTEVAPSIEDPFDPRHNLGESSTELSQSRFREEFARAKELCGRGASLAELLEPWMPPERTEGTADGKKEEDSN